MGFGLTGKQKMMITVLLAGTLLAVLNMTLLSPALPHIMADMNVSATTVQWLTSGYALVEACIIPMNAWLVGKFRTRQLFIGGIACFAVGSLIAAVSPSFAFLLLGRVFQAVATGIIMPMVFTLILLIFPREKRGSAMGVIGLIISFAPAIGPSLSGVLVDSVGWRYMFVIVTLLAVLVVIFALFTLEDAKEFEKAPFDVLSVVLMLPGMICLLYGLSSFSGADNLVMSLVMIAAGIVLLGFFVRRQLHLETPMLRIEVLKTRQFRTVVIIIALLQASLVGSEVVMPIYVQNVLGQSATTSGLIMLPGALVGAVCGVIAGRLFDRYGVRKLVVPGAIVLAAGGFMLTTYGMATPVLEVCLVYTVMELGIQFLVTPLNTWGVNSLDNSVIQHGNSLSSTTNQVGASFGTALIVSLTGLAAYFAAPDADAVTLSYTGVHVAFVGMSIMLGILALAILIFVRDRKAKTDSVSAPAVAPVAQAEEGTPGEDRPLRVRDVMNPDGVWLPVGSTVGDAMRLIGETETSGVPIVAEDGTLAGFVSDGDILKYLSKQSGFYTDGTNYFRLMEDASVMERLRDLTQLDVMRIATKNVITIEADGDPEDAFKTLSERRIKKVPVVENGKLVGALSRRNIIKALNRTVLETR